jgi:hypothetical protein
MGKKKKKKNINAQNDIVLEPVCILFHCKKRKWHFILNMTHGGKEEKRDSCFKHSLSMRWFWKYKLQNK